MKIITLTSPLSSNDIVLDDRSLSIALGHFDGVHRGHQQVINKAISRAKDKGLASAVMTFDPHPKAILGQGEQYSKCITPMKTKMKLFEQLGVDYVFVVRFNLEFAGISPKAFVDQLLHRLRVVNVVVGFDFRFGAKGAGTSEVLMQLCEPNIHVDVVDAFVIDDAKVSSTIIREYLEQGKIEDANALLGRNFEVEGIVVQGDQRGRTIGFPTANLRLDDPYLTIRLGVYAIIAHVGGRTFSGVLNHGMKPTFYTEDIIPVMEAHLFDFSEDIYGEHIVIEFVKFIRPEQRFAGINELIAQINKDAEEVKSLFLQT